MSVSAEVPVPDTSATIRERVAALASGRALDRHILSLALPAVAENLLATALYLVDTIMVAPLGSSVIGAAGASSVILWRVFMTAGCIERGTTAMVARYTGEGDKAKASRTAAQGILLGMLIGAAVTMVGIVYARRYLHWMGCPPDVVDAGTPYLIAIFAGSVPRLVTHVAGAAMRGAGDTRSPLRVMVWMNVANFVLNYLLIYGKLGFPRLGFVGSGIATALSFALSTFIFLRYLGRTSSVLHIRWRDFLPEPRLIRSMLRLSGPGLIDEIIISFGFLIFFGYIARMGTTALAAHTLATRIESLSFMAGFGFTVAAATMVGQALGMRSEDLAHRVFRRGTGLCVLVMSAISLVLILGGRWILAIFQPEQQVHDLAYALLIISAVEQPLIGVGMTLAGGLRGAGDTVSPMMVSFVGNVVIRLGAVHLFAIVMGLGIYGVYLGTVVDWIGRATMFYWAYHSGRWKRIRL